MINQTYSLSFDPPIQVLYTFAVHKRKLYEIYEVIFHFWLILLP
jgi:hypothetical protein